MALRLEGCCLPWQDARRRLKRLANVLLFLTALLLALYANAYTSQRAEQVQLFRYCALHPELIQAHYVGYIGMQPFWTLAGAYLAAFPAMGAALLGYDAAANYLRLRAGARGDYTLRRLRDPWEYHRRCLALPLLEALACLLAFAALTGLLYWSYLGLTPPELLPPAGQRFWG